MVKMVRIYDLYLRH